MIKDTKATAKGQLKDELRLAGLKKNIGEMWNVRKTRKGANKIKVDANAGRHMKELGTDVK